MQLYASFHLLSHTYLSTISIVPTHISKIHYELLEHTYIRLLLKFFVNKYIMLIYHQKACIFDMKV